MISLKKLTAGAAFAAGVGVGFIGGGASVGEGDLQYADSVQTVIAADEIIAAHKDTLRDTSGAITAINDVPQRIDRPRVVYRGGEDDTLSLGDTVKVIVLVNNKIYAEDTRAITQAARDGYCLKVYNRLLVHEEGVPVPEKRQPVELGEIQ